MTAELSPAELIASRAAAQLLSGAAPGDCAAAVSRLVGVQAQAPGPARLALRPRTRERTAEDVDRARADGALVCTWAMRGTLHLLAAADVRWITGLLGPVFARAGRRRREQLGLDEATCRKAFAALEDVLADGDPLTRPVLVDRLNARGLAIAPDTQAPPHLLAYAANSGLICRGPDTEAGDPTYALMDRWVPSATPLPREAALAELARRYLTGYGPSTPDDFAAWSGLPLTDAKRAFTAIASSSVEVKVQDRRMLALPDQLSPRTGAPARLLGHFDPYLLGYRRRDLVLDPAHTKKVQAGGGFLQPIATWRGRVVAVWKLEHRTGRSEVALTPFASLSPASEAALQEEVTDLSRFLTRRIAMKAAAPTPGPGGGSPGPLSEPGTASGRRTRSPASRAGGSAPRSDRSGP
ncbi:prevent-host-death protein [Actinomadura verrucosospora]|uniref:Prevent-host-death protein n=1 Tax=Actinomadura verrucosospora TaxID=46165 RepID=A0A7D3VPX5_ACTVE|nr:prevent-host-death protein [Actinomadura verrucosospora]